MRQGINGINIVDDEGNQYPTGGTMIWILHQALHRNPAYWKRPNKFIPERWLRNLIRDGRDNCLKI